MNPRFAKESIRVTGFLLGAVVTLLSVLTIYLHFSFDGEALSETLSRESFDAYGRKLSVDGDLHLDLWPQPTLVVQSLRLSEPDKDSDFLRLQNARFTLDLWPLVRKQIRVTQIYAQAADLNLLRDVEQNWNFTDLINLPADVQGLDRYLTPQSLRIDGLNLSVSDVASGVQLSLPSLQWQSGPLLAGSEGRLNLSGPLQDAAQRVQGKITLDTRYRWQSGQALSLSTLALRFVGTLAPLQEAQLDVSLDEANFAAADDVEWALRKLRVDVLGKYVDQALKARAQVPALDWRAGGPHAASVSLNASLQGAEKNLKTEAEWLDVSPGTGGFAVREFKLQVDASAGEQSLKGRLSTPLRASWREGRWEAERIAGSFDVRAPQLQAKSMAINLAGSANWLAAQGKQAAHSQIKLSAQSGKVWLSVDGDLQAVQPMSGQLNIDAREVDSALFKAPRTLVPQQAALADLAGWNLSGEVSAQKLTLGGVRITNLAMPYRFAQGRLEAAPQVLLANESDDLDGKLRGKLSLSLAPSAQGKFESQFEGVDLAAQARMLGIPFPLAGLAKGDVSFNLQGATAAELFAKSSGLTHLQFIDPAWLGVDFAAQLLKHAAPLKAAQRDGRSLIMAAKPGARQALQSLRSNFAWRDGQLYTQSLNASTAWLRIEGQGTLTPAKDVMDLALKTSLGNVPKTLPELVSLRGKALPLRLSGAILQPSLALDALAPKAAKAAPRPAPVVQP